MTAIRPDNAPPHVTLSGDLKGEYVVEDVLEDGRVIIRPDTSAEAMRRRAGLERMSPQEFETMFGGLPVDDEE